jgi:hypothetical protein
VYRLYTGCMLHTIYSCCIQLLYTVAVYSCCIRLPCTQYCLQHCTQVRELYIHSLQYTLHCIQSLYTLLYTVRNCISYCTQCCVQHCIQVLATVHLQFALLYTVAVYSCCIQLLYTVALYTVLSTALYTGTRNCTSTVCSIHCTVYSRCIHYCIQYVTVYRTVHSAVYSTVYRYSRLYIYSLRIMYTSAVYITVYSRCIHFNLCFWLSTACIQQILQLYSLYTASSPLRVGFLFVSVNSLYTVCQ